MMAPEMGNSVERLQARINELKLVATSGEIDYSISHSKRRRIKKPFTGNCHECNNRN